MSQTPNQAPQKPRRRKALNVLAVKKGVVFVTATLTAIGSGVTGLGAQIAYAPMLSWMLGYSNQKAQGVALGYAVSVSLSAVLVFAACDPENAVQLLGAVPVMIGGFLGALLAATMMRRKNASSQNRLFQSVGMMLMLFMMLQTARKTALTPEYALTLQPIPLYALIGMAAGALSQAMRLPIGILLIPALHYLAGLPPNLCIGFSLSVAALASLFPAWGYAKRGLGDAVYGGVAYAGGVLGGLLGGALMLWIASKDPKLLVYLFALVAMFFCAREMLQSPPEASPPAPKPDNAPA